MSKILEITGIRKKYPAFQLKDISFSIPEDCVMGFIGANGAGKTTTIRTILGLTPKSGGTIKLFGEEMNLKNEKELKNRIGVVLDEGCFYEDLMIKEMKSIIAPAYTGWSEHTFNDFMDRFGLNPKQKIVTLSKGMRMQFALALALSHNADLLIMDEPTSGLDPVIRSELLSIIADYMAQGGKGVLFSTHITSDLDKISDILVMIQGGAIVFEEEKDVLLDTYRIIKGDTKDLTDKSRELFLNLQTTEYGFTGITNRVSEVQGALKNIVTERAAIEDIMLAHIGRRG